MRLRPMPVVMVSSLTERGADITMACLEAGAVDFVTKPQSGISDGLARLAEELIGKLRAAAVARVTARESRPEAERTARPKMTVLRTTDRLVAIGASTGGTEAIADVLNSFPADGPAVRAVYPSSRHLSPKVRAFIDELLSAWRPIPPWDR